MKKKLEEQSAPVAGSSNTADEVKNVIAGSSNLADEEKKKKLKAQRDKRYRLKKKLEEQNCASEQERRRSVNAERNRKYRLKKKIEKQNALLAGSSNVVDDEEEKKKLKAERDKRYRLKKKLEELNCVSDQERRRSINADRNRKYRLKKKFVERNRASDQERRRNINVERNRKYRLKNKIELTGNRNCAAESNEEYAEAQAEANSEKFGSEIIAADIEFTKRFRDNAFGFACSVCDRLWFQKDLRSLPETSINLLQAEFPGENVSEFEVCSTCYCSLEKDRLPMLSRSNGFMYPRYPNDLPPLNCISERVLSPLLPFMQIRCLRFVNGAQSILGQVMNVPLEVNILIPTLPRGLDNDHTFNVHFKHHVIHKSSYLPGYVEKGDVEQWLKYLVSKQLYRINGIKIDSSFIQTTHHSDDESYDKGFGESGIESISENPGSVEELLLAQQQTLVWSEEKYLTLEPGMSKKPAFVIFDENQHTEELSFPSIYLGEPRTFKISNVTPFMMATSEVRRRDRRGVKPDHILYMAMKIMRLRLSEGLYLSSKLTGDTAGRADIEEKQCLERNLSFLKSVPSSMEYWMQHKKHSFAMIRQLGKPTVFLTLSASEYNWPQLLCLLFKLKNDGKEFDGEDPVSEFSPLQRALLVNEDPVTCCLYFNKLVEVIMFLLCSPRYSPFGEHRVKDFFKRIEFDQRGSPRAHVLLWLENDPKETVGENMPGTVHLIDKLCCVDPDRLEETGNQTHEHTFACSKRTKEENKECRLGAPFWPMKETLVLVPMTEEDSRRDLMGSKFKTMHQSLEQDFNDLDEFLAHHQLQSYDDYLNILRAGIHRPTVFLKRTMMQKWINNFNPWVANKLNSYMNIQFILDEYLCTKYVVEYVNKTNRGISSLQRDLIKLRDEHTDKDYADLMKELSLRMLNSIEISSQEAAWYLLRLGMCESSRKFEYIPTVWPHERLRVQKSNNPMDEEEAAGESLDRREHTFERYERRPYYMNNISLAQFVSYYYETKNGGYKRRAQPRVIHYRNYGMSKLEEYKREMVTLHVPFFNEQLEVLDCNKYLLIFNENEANILEASKEFESTVVKDKTGVL